ncbi:PLDc N-terminal domain-containing protein [Streptomyces gibsoniae]|uniref:PLDc N-terminal domain-containing protein n=1 Tax=Streptomyces gibsoniae TaxID=3075529 RepID=A0ABU2TRU1_9ACTN|nr:PLDc N-terminal domain-containing protein [Streptomyces sp. DSM 41699]MDT0463546.1 PLDc N-terminal domain-containing protein [Streptomyces sp. DSM 41699]
MHYIAALVLIVLFAAYCIFVVSALRGALTSRLELLAKVVWIAVIFALPFLGSLLWHLVGKKSALA